MLRIKQLVTFDDIFLSFLDLSSNDSSNKSPSLPPVNLSWSTHACLTVFSWEITFGPFCYDDGKLLSGHLHSRESKRITKEVAWGKKTVLRRYHDIVTATETNGQKQLSHHALMLGQLWLISHGPLTHWKDSLFIIDCSTYFKVMISDSSCLQIGILIFLRVEHYFGQQHTSYSRKSIWYSIPWDKLQFDFLRVLTVRGCVTIPFNIRTFGIWNNVNICLLFPHSLSKIISFVNLGRSSSKPETTIRTVINGILSHNITIWMIYCVFYRRKLGTIIIYRFSFLLSRFLSSPLVLK